MSCGVSELQHSSCRLRGSSQGSAGGVVGVGDDDDCGSTAAATLDTSEKEGSLNKSQSHKPCCLCWCCCCSCSWARCAAIKNAEDNDPTRRDPASSELLFDGEDEMSVFERPTLDEIRSWGENFDKLMRSSAGRKVFRDFLRCEYSEENILFWLACEDLKLETNPDRIEERARFIYEDYISILSPKEVSLDSRVREMVNRNMVEPTPNTFDEAQLQIYTLMHRDSYPRFVNSPLYKAIAQLEGVSTTGSIAESPT